jgi:hypothetical protein
VFWTTVKVFAGIPTLSQNGGVGREIPANVKTTVHMSHTPCSQVVSIIVIMSRRTVRVNEHEDTREYMRVRSNTRKATAKKRSWNLFRRCREKWRIPSIGVDCRVSTKTEGRRVNSTSEGRRTIFHVGECQTRGQGAESVRYYQHHRVAVSFRSLFV